MNQYEEKNLNNQTGIILNFEQKNLLELKMVSALFSALYKNNLINKKEYNLLIAQLNRKLQDSNL